MIKSKKDLIFNYLKSSPEEIENLLLNKKKHYLSFYIPKYDEKGNIRMKDGKEERRYFIYSIGKLKVIQKRLLKNVFYKIPLLRCIKGGVRGESSISNAKEHKGKKYRFQTDLRNFFPSITSKQIIKALKGKGFSIQNAKLITKLVDYDSALTQGNPTSMFIANLVFEKVDEKLLSLIKGKKITYTRWVDDLTFSSPDNFQPIIGIIIKTISQNGFIVHRKKTGYRSKRSKITGVDVGNNTLKPTQAFLVVDENNLTPAQIQGRREYLRRVLMISKKGQ